MGLLGAALGREPDVLTLGLYLLVLLFGVAALALLALGLGYRRLVYALGDAGLEVRWLGWQYRVPYAAIEGIYTGQRLVGNATPDGLSWPGLYTGTRRARGVGRLHFFTTSPDPAELTLLALPALGVVVSPEDPGGFRTALIEHLQASADEPTPEQPFYAEPVHEAPWSALGDRWALGSIAAAAVLLALEFAILTTAYGGLPDRVPLRFDASNRPVEIGFRGDLYRLPLGGLMILLGNTALGVWLHPRVPLLARLLWIGGGLVEAILLVALIRLVQ